LQAGNRCLEFPYLCLKPGYLRFQLSDCFRLVANQFCLFADNFRLFFD
jgi:hypothetical protein